MTYVETIRAYIKARKKHGRDCVCADCEDHNAALAALEQIERDTARLDWLDSHGYAAGANALDSIRETIDAAMQASKLKPGNT